MNLHLIEAAIAISFLEGLLLYVYHIKTGRGLAFSQYGINLGSGMLLMLAMPFPYIANTAGWMTAELGRQPWLVYGLMRTEDGYSTLVSAGNGMFTLLGFMGMYMVLGILGLFLIWHEIEHGPAAQEPLSNLQQAVR